MSPSMPSAINNFGGVTTFLDDPSQLLVPQWRMDQSDKWASGYRISIDHVGDGLHGIEAEYRELGAFKLAGTVQDEDSGTPIERARVTVAIREGDDKDSMPTLLGEYTTGKDGSYMATLPLDLALKNARPHVWNRLLCILSVKHSSYASTVEQCETLGLAFGGNDISTGGLPSLKGPTGSPIRPTTRGILDVMEIHSLAATDAVELSPIFVRPGKEITGFLQTPEGIPVAGVKVVASTLVHVGMWCISATHQFSGMESPRDLPVQQWYGWEESTTDHNGRFRILLSSEGVATLAIWPAKEFVLVTKDIGRKRGDLGSIKLERGPTIHGRVIDSAGKPMANIYLNTEPLNVESKRLDSQENARLNTCNSRL